jgi:hypothetical protein
MHRRPSTTTAPKPVASRGLTILRRKECCEICTPCLDARVSLNQGRTVRWLARRLPCAKSQAEADHLAPGLEPSQLRFGRNTLHEQSLHPTPRPQLAKEGPGRPPRELEPDCPSGIVAISHDCLTHQGQATTCSNGVVAVMLLLTTPWARKDRLRTGSAFAPLPPSGACAEEKALQARDNTWRRPGLAHFACFFSSSSAGLGCMRGGP